MSDFKIILFGAGGTGENLYERLGKYVVAFADNDTTKQGSNLLGKKIIAPNEIAGQQFDAIVIASIFEDEIKKQLVELGFGDKIVTYNSAKESAFGSGLEGLEFAIDLEMGKPLLRTMHLNLTSACNLECRICRPENFEYKADYLDRETLEKIVDDVFDDLTHLRLDSSGELTLSPHLEYVLAEATKRNISIFISTNGTRIDENIAEKIVSSTVETIQVSLDSPDKQTSEWIRKGAKHEDILRGVKNLVEAKKKQGGEFPKIHFHAAILRQNIDHLTDLVQLAHDMEIDGITLAYGFIHSYMDPDWSIFFAQKSCNAKVVSARQHAHKLGIFFNSPQAFLTGNNSFSNKYCMYLFNWTYIDPTGEVYPCCVGAGGYSLGNVRTEKLSDIWLGQKYQKLRETYNTDTPVLDKCSRCYILEGWNVDDYKVHFDKNHWPLVRKRLSELEK